MPEDIETPDDFGEPDDMTLEGPEVDFAEVPDASDSNSDNDPDYDPLEHLARAHYAGPALAVATAAFEITIRFLLLRPLVQGAFLSDRWAAILASRVATGRTAEDREMLPAILREWGIDVTKVTSASGILVWPFFITKLRGLRDKFVHQFDPVAPEVAAQTIECALAFRTDVVGKVAKRLGFTLDATQRWSVLKKLNGTLEESETADPFVEGLKPKKP